MAACAGGLGGELAAAADAYERWFQIVPFEPAQNDRSKILIQFLHEVTGNLSEVAACGIAVINESTLAHAVKNRLGVVMGLRIRLDDCADKNVRWCIRSCETCGKRLFRRRVAAGVILPVV